MPLTTRKQSSSLFSLCWRCQELGENTEFGPLRTDDQLAKQDTQMPPPFPGGWAGFQKSQPLNANASAESNVQGQTALRNTHVCQYA